MLLAAGASAQESVGMDNVAGGGRRFFSNRRTILETAEVPVIEPKATVRAQGATGGGKTDGYKDLAADRWVGTFGFASCVGMTVVWEEGGSKRALVSHFNVENDPEETIARFESQNKMPIGEGAYAYVAGGDDTSASNDVLAKMILALKKRGVKVRSYIPYSSLWVNGKGEVGYSAAKNMYADGWVSPVASAAADAAEKRAIEVQGAAAKRALGVGGAHL
jgi:hypothetical protein